MAAAPEKKPRPENPQCGDCSHPSTFHKKRDPKTHRRKCTAFGCSCANFKKAEKAVV